MRQDDSPMIIRTNPIQYIYPDCPCNELTIQEDINLYCPSNDMFIYRYPNKNTKIQQMQTIQCIDDTIFIINGTEAEFKTTRCKSISKGKNFSKLRSDGTDCYGGKRYEIGYEIITMTDNYGFLRTIDLCHDKNASKTVWAHSTIVPGLSDYSRNRNDKKENFAFRSTLYGEIAITAAEPYKKQIQYKTMKKILNKQVKKYFSENGM